MPKNIERKRQRNREYMRRRREAARKSGTVLPSDKWKEENKERKQEYGREYMRQKRTEARERGELLPSDSIHLTDREKWREIQRRSYEKNIEARRAKGREKQARRRSTPWGKINNRIWPLLHRGIALRSESWGKYNVVAGYTWAGLARHLEAQFAPDMNWNNWGEIWELDHIEPLSGFQYQSIDDPLFRQAWRLENLRPRYRVENTSAGGYIGAAKANGK